MDNGKRRICGYCTSLKTNVDFLVEHENSYAENSLIIL